MPNCCAVAKCKTGYKSLRVKRSVFKVPNNLELIEKWRAVVPGVKSLTHKSYVCERHFKEDDIIRRYRKLDCNNRVIADVPFKYPRLKQDAVPSIFTPDEDIDASSRMVVHSQNELSSLNSANENNVCDRNEEFQVEFVDVSTNIIEDCQLDLKPVKSSSVSNDKSERTEPTPQQQETQDFLTSLSIAIQADILNGENSNLNKDFRFITPSWMRTPSGVKKRVTFSHIKQLRKEDISYPIFDKYVTIDKERNICYFVFGRLIKADEAGLVEILSDTKLLRNVLSRFESINLCAGVGKVNAEYLQVTDGFNDYFKEWHSNDCSLVCKKRRCKQCTKLRNNVLQKERRCKKNLPISRIRKAFNPIDQQKLISTKQKIKRQQLQLLKIKEETDLLRKSLFNKTEELANVCKKTIDQKCYNLNISDTQKTTLHEIVNAASVSTSNGRRYSDEWIMQCLLLNIRSPSCYEFLRIHDIIPLPCTRTIRRYFSLVNNSCGFDKSFAHLLKSHFTQLKKRNVNCGGVLVLGEINLRKAVQVCSKSITYARLTSFRDDAQQSQDIRDEATHGFVIMYQSLESKYTQPIAVVASRNPIDGQKLARLITNAIAYLENCGAVIHGVIADGIIVNKKVWSLLGVSGTIGDVKTWFTHPLNENRKVFVFSDTSHLIKCMRNRIQQMRSLRLNRSANSIKWEYFENLYKIDTSEGNPRVCPKITKKHIELDCTSKTRDRFATQIFSNSVANGLKWYLDRKEEVFIGCEETIKFCKQLNDTFDALNQTNWNQGLTPDSDDFKVLEYSLEWLNSWENAMINVDIHPEEFLTIETARALRMTLISTMEICKYLIDQFDFKCLLPGNVNQDNMEVFFGAIRQPSCTDHPQCPNTLQIYKLLSIYNISQPPKYGNYSVSDSSPSSVMVSLKELKKAASERNHSKSLLLKNIANEKLDMVFQTKDWETNNVIQHANGHDYALTNPTGSVIYHVTGFPML